MNFKSDLSIILKQNYLYVNDRKIMFENWEKFVKETIKDRYIAPKGSEPKIEDSMQLQPEEKISGQAQVYATLGTNRSKGN